MKLGCFTVVYADRSLEEALNALSNLSLDMIELGTGGFIPKIHCDPGALLADPSKLKALKSLIAGRGVEISALSCHGNVVHPDKSISEQHTRDFKEALQLCGELGVDCVVGFAGCPGDSEDAKCPNWVTCSWPDYYADLLKWQWEEKLIPTWKEIAKHAKKCGVEKIALEMHPGDAVFNPERLLKLREAVGPAIGSNFDPSHLFWQGMDPCLAARELRECIFHVHAKDSAVEKGVAERFGVLETKNLSAEGRGWNFKTVGYGHGEEFWRAFIWTLKEIGYDGVISIEHEDHQMSLEEGLNKAAGFLNGVIIREEPAALWFDRS
ncbi:sugar phosphate isomerase/epimerase [Candidatus Bipolaricaulota bacterium]|nr:sugar phosphate isomerase/epimerase [Candidatus Bipolaricaulota bacterium]